MKPYFCTGLSVVLTVLSLAKAQTQVELHVTQIPLLTSEHGVSRQGIQHLAEIISTSQIKQAIILRNFTDAPREVHIRRLYRLIESNPELKDIWEFTEIAPSMLKEREVRHFTTGAGFFTVVFVTTNGDSIGFELHKEGIRVSWEYGTAAIDWDTTAGRD